MREVSIVLKEAGQNLSRIWRLARYEKKAKINETRLGRVWDFLSPALQIFVYWLVFGVGFKARSDQDGFPFIVWMVTGMTPWFFMSSVLLSSSNAISSNSSIIGNMNIPLTIIPAKEIAIRLIDHLWMCVATLIVLICFRVQPHWYMFQILYYFAAMVIFVFAFSLLSSSLGVLFADWGKIMAPIVRLLFYVSYTISPLDGLKGTAQTLLKLNPLAYITMGYRDSMLFQRGFWEKSWQTPYFWAVTLIILVIGCRLHVRTRSSYADLL